jgi:hypothetical protein
MKSFLIFSLFLCLFMASCKLPLLQPIPVIVTEKSVDTLVVTNTIIQTDSVFQGVQTYTVYDTIPCPDSTIVVVERTEYVKLPPKVVTYRDTITKTESLRQATSPQVIPTSTSTPTGILWWERAAWAVFSLVILFFRNKKKKR